MENKTKHFEGKVKDDIPKISINDEGKFVKQFEDAANKAMTRSKIVEIRFIGVEFDYKKVKIGEDIVNRKWFYGMAKWTKAKRSAAAKKAARTRKVKNQKTEAKRKKVAKKAKAAGTDSEVGFKRKLERKGNLVLNGKGIPDIIAKKGKRWTFYEIKPHQVRRGYDNKGPSLKISLLYKDFQ